MDNHKVTFTGICIAETDSDLLIHFDFEDKKLWIPQSQIDEDSEVYRVGDEGFVVISEWIALKKGLIQMKTITLDSGEKVRFGEVHVYITQGKYIIVLNYKDLEEILQKKPKKKLEREYDGFPR